MNEWTDRSALHKKMLHRESRWIVGTAYELTCRILHNKTARIYRERGRISFLPRLLNFHFIQLFYVKRLPTNPETKVPPKNRTSTFSPLRLLIPLAHTSLSLSLFVTSRNWSCLLFQLYKYITQLGIYKKKRDVVMTKGQPLLLLFLFVSSCYLSSGSILIVSAQIDFPSLSLSFPDASLASIPTSLRTWFALKTSHRPVKMRCKRILFFNDPKLVLQIWPTES